MLKKTEHHTTLFESSFGGGQPADMSKLPNYKLTSLSPLRFANEGEPEDFQVKMDERNRIQARRF